MHDVARVSMEAREAGLSPQHQRERSMPCVHSIEKVVVMRFSVKPKPVCVTARTSYRHLRRVLKDSDRLEGTVMKSKWSTRRGLGV